MTGVSIQDEQHERLVAWATTPEAAEVVGKVLDPGAWRYADFVVSRNRARRKGRALLDQLVSTLK